MRSMDIINSPQPSWLQPFEQYLNGLIQIQFLSSSRFGVVVEFGFGMMCAAGHGASSYNNGMEGKAVGSRPTRCMWNLTIKTKTDMWQQLASRIKKGGWRGFMNLLLCTNNSNFKTQKAGIKESDKKSKGLNKLLCPVDLSQPQLNPYNPNLSDQVSKFSNLCECSTFQIYFKS